MISILKIAVAPLLGGVIGYITNDLALKMLFHPYKAVYIGKWHVPFTPGLIPAQKDRLAKSLGRVVGGQLLDPETIRREALSDEAQDKLRRAIQDFLESQAADSRSLREKLSAIVPPEQLTVYEGELIDRGGLFIMNQILQAKLGEVFARHTIHAIRERMQHLPFGALLDGGLFSAMESAVAGAIDQKILERGPALVHEKITAAEEELMGRPFCDLVAEYREQIPALTERLLDLYRSLLENSLESLLSAAHIDEIVEHKIQSFSAADLEQLIFGIMKRELRAIVYLGAALGFLMGFINLLF